jgi:hypothetical protein
MRLNSLENYIPDLKLDVIFLLQVLHHLSVSATAASLKCGDAGQVVGNAHYPD